MSAGRGLLKGLMVTARNFVGSYFEADRLVTQQYPEEKAHTKENFRNVPFLLYDGADAIQGMRCVACKICEQECPPQCIYIEGTFDAEGNSLKTPKVFDIDFTVCMNCGICAEACPFDAIKMDNEFELASTDRFNGQLADLHRLLKSNEYYHQIKPTEAGDVDERLAAKAKKSAAKKAPAPAATPPTSPVPAAKAAPAPAGDKAPRPDAKPAAGPPPPPPPPSGPAEVIALPSADAPPLPPPPGSGAPTAAAPPPPPPPPPGEQEVIAPPSADAPPLPPPPASNPPVSAAPPPPPAPAAGPPGQAGGDAKDGSKT